MATPHSSYRFKKDELDRWREAADEKDLDLTEWLRQAADKAADPSVERDHPASA